VWPLSKKPVATKVETLRAELRVRQQEMEAARLDLRRSVKRLIDATDVDIAISDLSKDLGGK